MATSACPATNRSIDTRPIVFFDIDNCVCDATVSEFEIY